MNNIWIATDWHLWNTEYDDGRHKFKSITRLGQLADEYTSVIGTNDLFIHLGDLCDPSNTKPEKLKAIIQSIPGTKILCRGNHDTEPDEYYLAAGFDHVCEILVIHDLVFSHKPVNVGVDQINIHGHLHTRKLSTLDSRYLNAYDVNYSDKPVLLEDLLQHAVQQTKADYTDTEFKQDKVDKMFDSIDNDHYENILNLSDEFDLEQQLIQENETYKQMLKDNSIDTGINIHDLMNESFFKRKSKQHARKYDDDDIEEVVKIYRVPKPTPVNKTYNSEKNLITDIESDCKSWINKMLSSSKFEDDFNEIKNDTDLIDEWNLQTHNKPLNKNNVKQELDIKCKYDKFENGVEGITVFDGYQELRITYSDFVLSLCKLLEFKYFDWITSVNYGDGDEGFVYFKINRDKFNLTEASIAPVLHSLSATEIEKDDRLDEVIYDSEDEEDTPFIDESYSIKKRKMGNNYFLVHQVDELFENGTETIGPEVVTMCEDFLDAAIQILPEDLNEETLAAINSAEKLVDYLTELFYYDENDTSERYRKHSFVMQVVSAIARQMVRDKKALTPITLTRELDDIIPQNLTEEQFNEFIQAGINKLKEIENAAANALVLNSVLLGVNENLNSIYAIKQEIKKNKDKIIIKSGFGPIEYNYKYPRYARGRVFFSRETYSEFVIRDKVLTPERLYARAVFYDFIIVSHEKYSDQFNYKIQQVMIDNNPYDDVMDIIKYLNKNYDNPKILLLACNSKSFDLDKYSNVTYADAPIMEAAIPAYNMNLTASDTMSEVSTIVKVHTKAANKTRKKIKKLVEASDYFGTTEKEYKELQKDNEFASRFGKPTLKLIICNNAGKKNLVEKKTGISGIALSEIDWYMAPKAFVSILDIVDYYLYYFEAVAKYMHTKLNSLSENYGFNIDMPSSVTFTEYNIRPVQDMGFSNLQECAYFAERYQLISENVDKVNITKDGKVIKSIDSMDEVVFEDPEDTIYWEQDDDNPKLYKEKEPMAEAVGAAIMTGMTIASGVASTAKTISDWYKKNDITEYVIFNASENKMYKCIDNTYKFEKTAEIAEKQVDKTFVFLRTSNNLDKKQTERYNTARKYWSKVKSEHKKATKNESIDLFEEVTLTVEHLAELHKAHPELSTILPDDGKDIHDPTKYYCSKVWMQNENVIATASIRYPQANAAHYSEIQDINISEGYEFYTNSIMNRVNELYDSRITESVMISTTDPVDIYDYKYEVLEEATKGSDILYPVYVILTNSGHASISFNTELKTMYTFGMKQEDNAGFGFDVKSINDNHDDNTLYSVYCVFVNQAQLKKLKDRVQYFVKHETDFLFDYPGIELNDTNLSANSQHRWFCSRFVTDLLNIGSSNKKTQYITDDLSKTNFAHYICGGSIKSFKSSNIEAQTLRALEQEKNERILRDKKPLNIVQGLQEAASTLSPATRDDMNKLNAKWDLRPIGYGDRDKYIAEEEEKLKRMKEHDRKIKEMKDRNKQRIKAEKQAKKARKLKVKNEEVHDPFNVLDQERFFDWNDYHNTVLGESSFKLELEDKNFQFLMDMNESATGNNKLVPVFVILTHSHSAVSKLVQATTGDEYTHASISFDSSLTHMYTFGRTSDSSVLKGSFKIEDISSAYYQNHTPPIPYSLFCIPVTEAQKKKMEKKVNYFAKNKNKFHFDFFGLFVNAMGIPNNPKNRYFCSRFVSVILNAGDPKNPLVSEPSLQRPYSFAGDDYVRFVCSGENIALYDQVVADRIIKDIMRTEKLVRAQKSRVKNENFLGINSSDPFISDVLHYKFAMLDESGMDNFMRYLSSFKIQFDKEGNVIISRKEYDQLDKHFRESVRLCRTYSEAGNVEGIKEELAKVHYMIQLINKYYLSPNANKNPRMKSDIKKDMLDLRSVILNHFNTYMKWITIREPQFNFQAYYDTSKYGNTNMVPAKVLTAVGKVLVTAL